MSRTSIPAVDRRLLAALERSFSAIAGADRVIDAGELQRALGLKSPYLAQRMLAIFDRDGNGVISKDEFLAGVQKLVLGTDREKLAFAFQLHDADGDGAIDQAELVRMIAISLADADVMPRGSHDAETLARGLLRAADRNGDGRISLAELEQVLAVRPEILEEMTRSEAQWLAPSEDVLARLERGPGALTRGMRYARFFANRLPLVSAVGVWAFVNVAVLVGTLARALWLDGAEWWTSVAQATGAGIVLDGALVFLPILRRALTRVRASFAGRFVPVDDAVDLHRLIGHTLFGLALVHALAATIAYMRGHGVDHVLALFTSTLRGPSGLALVAVLSVMWAFALGVVRRSRFFELFHFTHLLYVVWLALAILHAPSFVVWAGLAALGLSVEHGVRMLRRGVPTVARHVEPLRSGVTKIELDKPQGFRFRAGDYAFLRVPALAKHEWHPFTISSAPEDETLTVHVRSLGNWTRALRRLAEAREQDPSVPPLVVHLDGPYGSPATHIERAPNVVLVGAGIGVTPFASVLSSLFSRERRAAGKGPRKVHFFWLNRDQYSFEWFREVLARLETEAGAALDLHLYMTDARRGATSMALEAARHAAQVAGEKDIVTELRTLTRFGHPDWAHVLAEIAKQHDPGTVALFFCGPPGLGAKVRAACAKTGIPYHEERF